MNNAIAERRRVLIISRNQLAHCEYQLGCIANQINYLVRERKRIIDIVNRLRGNISRNLIPNVTTAANISSNLQTIFEIEDVPEKVPESLPEKVPESLPEKVQESLPEAVQENQLE